MAELPSPVEEVTVKDRTYHNAFQELTKDSQTREETRDLALVRAVHKTLNSGRRILVVLKSDDGVCRSSASCIGCSNACCSTR